MVRSSQSSDIQVVSAVDVDITQVTGLEGCEPYEVVVAISDAAWSPPYQIVLTEMPSGGEYTLTHNSSSIFASFFVPVNAAGTYSYEAAIMDVDGCSGVSPDFLAVVEPQLSISVHSATTDICIGESVELEIEIDQGTAPYQIRVWQNGELVDDFLTSNSLDVLEEYVVEVTDDGNCVAEKSLEEAILVLPDPQVNMMPPPIQQCQLDGETVIIDLSTYEGQISSQHIVRWYEDPQAQFSLGNYTAYPVDASGSVYAQAETIEGCLSTVVEVSIELSGEPQPSLSINGGSATTICIGDEAEVEVLYEWAHGPTTKAVFVGPGTYTVSVTSGDCQGQQSVTITEGGITSVDCSQLDAGLLVNTADAILPISVYWTSDSEQGAEILINESQYLIQDVPQGTYDITVEDALGCSQECSAELVIVSTDDITSDITISPNPVLDILYVKGLLHGSYRLRVLDMSGKLILHQYGYIGGIPVDQLSSGLYIILVSDEVGDLIVTRKFVKQ